MEKPAWERNDGGDVQSDYDYVDTKVTQTTVLGGEQNRKYAFLVLRDILDGKFVHRSVVIFSEYVRTAIASVLENIKGISLTDTTLEIPFMILFFYTVEIRAYAEKQSPETPEGKHIRVLLRYLDNDCRDTRKDVEEMKQRGIITFDFVWALFKPGTIAITRIDKYSKDHRCFQVVQVSKTTGDKYVLDGRFVSTDGVTAGYGSLALEIDRFNGTKAISKLPAYPLENCKNPKAMTDYMISRGKKFFNFLDSQGNMQNYSGLAFVDGKQREHFEGRVCFDAEFYWRYREEDRSIPTLDDLEYTSSSESIFKTPKGTSYTQEHLLISDPCFYGFLESEKCWASLYWSQVDKVEWEEEPLSSLVLKKSTLSDIQSFIASCERLKASQTGPFCCKSMVLVLHGPHETGKKSTAKAVAETLRVPLLSSEVGDLTEKPNDMEYELMKCFRRAQRWCAVVVIHNAEVFLETEKRQRKHVSILLRMINDYRVILILTSDLVRHMNKDVAPRFNVCIEYEEPDLGQRKLLWVHFFTAAVKNQNPELHEILNFNGDRWEKVFQVKLNVRQIQRIVDAASSNAFGASEPLKVIHVGRLLERFDKHFEAWRHIRDQMFN